MTAEKQSQASGLTLEVEGSARPIEFVAPEDDERIRGLLAQRQSLRVQIDGADDSGDTEGHAFSDRALVSVRILDDEDDTEGHALSVHFPTVEDARDFRNRVIVAGALVGTMTIAGLGVGAALDQAPGIGTGGAGGADAQVSDSWQRMGVPGTAAGAGAAADQLTDSWQRTGVPGTGAAASAEADKLTDSWQRMQTPGTNAPAVNPDELTDSWQRMQTPGTDAPAVNPDELTDSWQRMQTPGTGAGGETEDDSDG